MISPLVNNAVTVCLIGVGNKAFKSFEKACIHRLSDGSKQNMRSKEAQRFFFLVDIAGVLANELPKSINVAELLNVVQSRIVLIVQTCSKYGNKDILCRASIQTGKDSHNVNMELQRCLVFASDFAKFLAAILAFEELAV